MGAQKQLESGTIKNLIFDLGGVILEIDPERTLNAFRQLGIKNIDSLYTLKKQSGIFDEFDTGKTDLDTFRQNLRKASGNNFTDEEFNHAWCAMLVEFPPKRISLLEGLKKQFRCFLFSNTNVLHHKVYTEMLQETTGHDSLAELFEKAYFSHTFGMRKPNIQVFNRILEENNLKAEQTLFLDDLKQNTDAAREAGINAIQISPENNLLKIFSAYRVNQ